MKNNVSLSEVRQYRDSCLKPITQSIYRVIGASHPVKCMVFLISFILILSHMGFTQTVVHIPTSINSLEDSWTWVKQEISKNDQKKDFFLGYLIPNQSPKQIHICKHHNHQDEKSLYQLIHGNTSEPIQCKNQPNHTAILFKYKRTSDNILAYEKFEILNFFQPHKIGNDLLFWIDKISTPKSVNFLSQCFQRIQSPDIKEELVTAIGIHGADPIVFSFLKKVLFGKHKAQVREIAAFWMGNQHTVEAAEILMDRIQRDESPKVKDQSIFGLYLLKNKEGTDALIKLARQSKHINIRKDAIFWLGQKATKKCAETLKDIVRDESVTEIQEGAVFAISQLPDGTDSLIKIAKTHKSLQVRKKAIFWLSQSENPKALETILEILEK